MTKKELVKALEGYSDETEIELSIPSGIDRIWFDIKEIENEIKTKHCLIIAGAVTMA